MTARDYGTAWRREQFIEALTACERGAAPTPVAHIAVEHEATPEADGSVTFVASDESQDRMGDVLRADGWDLEAYRRNPVVLWGHDYSLLPIGRAERVWVQGRRLLASVAFAPTRLAQEVKALYEGGFLRTVSVGFRPLEFRFRTSRTGEVEGVEYVRQELLEISAVPVPANPSALMKALPGLPTVRRFFDAAAPAEGRLSEEDGRRVAAALEETARVVRGAATAGRERTGRSER